INVLEKISFDARSRIISSNRQKLEKEINELSDDTKLIQSFLEQKEKTNKNDEESKRPEELTLSQLMDELVFPDNSLLLDKVAAALSSDNREILQAFDHIKNEPAKFLALAHAVANAPEQNIANISRFLEGLDWPSHEMRDKHLHPLILTIVDRREALCWQ